MVMVKILQKIGCTVSTRIILKENVSIFLKITAWHDLNKSICSNPRSTQIPVSLSESASIFLL